jgi:hypothetical protein
MRYQYGIFCVLGVLLAGCAPDPNGVPGLSVAQNAPIIGYRYYDNFHPNFVNNPSPQAIYNAQHGTYLWPPASENFH